MLGRICVAGGLVIRGVDKNGAATCHLIYCCSISLLYDVRSSRNAIVGCNLLKSESDSEMLLEKTFGQKECHQNGCEETC